MNKKLIIAAVSAAIVAPVVSYADTTAYGRARGIIQSVESATDIHSDIRFGLKASGDIGNGLNAHAKVEMDVDPDSKNAITGKSLTRVAKAGLSGPFGTVQMGQMWSAYYAFGSMISLSNHGNTIGSGILRSPNTIKYSNSFGPVSLAIDARFNDGGDSDAKSPSGLGIGLTLNPIDALTIGIATDTANGTDAVKVAAVVEEVSNKRSPTFVPAAEAVTAAAAGEDTKLTGIAARYTLGNGLFGTIGVQKKEKGAEEDEDQFVWIGGPITSNTSWLLGSYESENELKREQKETTWGIYHSVGGGLSIYYEGDKYDNGYTADKDVSKHTVGMVFGF